MRLFALLVLAVVPLELSAGRWLIDDPPTVLRQIAGEPRIAVGDGQVLFFWTTSSGERSYMRRFDANREAIDPTAVLLPGIVTHVAWSGRYWFLAVDGADGPELWRSGPSADDVLEMISPLLAGSVMALSATPDWGVMTHLRDGLLSAILFDGEGELVRGVPLIENLPSESVVTSIAGVGQVAVFVHRPALPLLAFELTPQGQAARRIEIPVVPAEPPAIFVTPDGYMVVAPPMLAATPLDRNFELRGPSVSNAVASPRIIGGGVSGDELVVAFEGQGGFAWVSRLNHLGVVVATELLAARSLYSFEPLGDSWVATELSATHASALWFSAGTGTVLATRPLSVAHLPQRDFVAAAGGEVTLVVWSEPTEDGWQQRYRALRWRDGVALDAAAIELGTFISPFPRVTFDGRNFVVAEVDRQMSGVRVSPAGELLDSRPQEILDYQPVYFGTIARGGRIGEIAALSHSLTTISISLIDTGGSFQRVSPIVAIGATAGFEITTARLLRLSDGYLLIWTEEQSCPLGCPVVPLATYTVRLSDSLVASPRVRLGSFAFEAVSEGGQGDQRLIAWTSGGQLRATRLDPNGMPLDFSGDEAGVAISGVPGSASSLIFHDGEWLLALRRSGSATPLLRLTPDLRPIALRSAVPSTLFAPDVPALLLGGDPFATLLITRPHGGSAVLRGYVEPLEASVADLRIDLQMPLHALPPTMSGQRFMISNRGGSVVEQASFVFRAVATPARVIFSDQWSCTTSGFLTYCLLQEPLAPGASNSIEVHWLVSTEPAEWRAMVSPAAWDLTPHDNLAFEGMEPAPPPPPQRRRGVRR
jgi:hypothetical protein